MPTEPPVPDLPEQMQVRRDKLGRLAAEGVDPYPLGYPRTTTVRALREEYPELEPGTETGKAAAVTGRVVLNRPTGKLVFATIQDGDDRIQVMLARDVVGADRLDAWKGEIDLGDQVGVTGEVIATRTGELTVRASEWALTNKALRPLPDKRHGLTDPEARVRQRYVDLIVNPAARRMVYQRAEVVDSLRASLRRRGFVEVDTPMLQPVHGGATARPFVTHHNALDLELYLRIAPELYLKRLLVGGVDKVFELNRNFRNEGVDTSHNPEFSSLEFYEAYGDYDTGAQLTTELVQEAARALYGTEVVPRPDGRELDLSGSWRQRTVHDAVSEAVGEQVVSTTPTQELRRIADRLDIAYRPEWGPGALVLELYEQLVERQTEEPTFYRDFPVEVSPLVRRHRHDPKLAERWDLVVEGRELGTGYSELVDPVEQRRRLTEQSLLAAGGDVEAMSLDEDFLRALEYGMPPTGGVGFGIERLLMVLTGVASIREVILFPLVRPQ